MSDYPDIRCLANDETWPWLSRGDPLEAKRDFKLLTAYTTNHVIRAVLSVTKNKGKQSALFGKTFEEKSFQRVKFSIAP